MKTDKFHFDFLPRLLMAYCEIFSHVRRGFSCQLVQAVTMNFVVNRTKDQLWQEFYQLIENTVQCSQTKIIADDDFRSLPNLLCHFLATTQVWQYITSNTEGKQIAKLIHTTLVRDLTPPRLTLDQHDYNTWLQEPSSGFFGNLRCGRQHPITSVDISRLYSHFTKFLATPTFC